MKELGVVFILIIRLFLCPGPPSGEFHCRVPSLGAVIGVSACARTVRPGRHVETYNIIPSFKSIRGFPYCPLHEFFVKTERLSLPTISKRTR